MLLAVAVGSIQRKNNFTVAEWESKNSIVAEGGILVSNEEVLKGRWHGSWFKNPQGGVPLPDQLNLFLIKRVIFVLQVSYLSNIQSLL